jgi:hypothetical protein
MSAIVTPARAAYAEHLADESACAMMIGTGMPAATRSSYGLDKSARTVQAWVGRKYNIKDFHGARLGCGRAPLATLPAPEPM